MQIPVKIRSIRTRGKRRITSIFFPSNFPLVAPTYDILSKDRSKVFHSNKALLCVYFYAYISLRIFGNFVESPVEFFSPERKLAHGTLVKPFDHTRNLTTTNVAIHPYFHVLCVISLSVSYGGALFTPARNLPLCRTIAY